MNNLENKIPSNTYWKDFKVLEFLKRRVRIGRPANLSRLDNRNVIKEIIVINAFK